MGKVYIRVTQPFNVKDLELHIKGREKVEWEERGDDETHEYHGKKKLIDFKQTVFVFPPGGLQPGDYTIGFEFMLPVDLPASMHFD